MYYKIINRKKRWATMAADLVGSLLFLPLLPFRKKGPIRPDTVRNILVIRTAYIGDVVMTLPLLGPLKELYPAARLSVLTARSAAPVLENNPHVDEVIPYDPFWFYPTAKGAYLDFIRTMRRQHFDLVIEARADIRELLFLVAPLKKRYALSYRVGGGWYFLTHTVPFAGISHKIDYHLDIARYLGWQGDEVQWRLHLTPEEEGRAAAILARHGVDGPFVAAHPGSRIPLKRWAPEKCARLYDRLIREYKRPLILFGVARERELVEGIIGRMEEKAISLAGEVSLREMAAILSGADLFFCNDSAPMHVGAAMGAPTVALFGPSKSKETGPYGPQCRVVEKEFPCRYHCDENTCTFPTHNACMEAISPDDVMVVAATLLPQSDMLAKGLYS